MGEELETKPFGRNSCHICDSMDFEWGHLLTGRGDYTYYVSDDRTTMQKFLVSGLKTIRVRRCRVCDNIQFFSPASPKPKDGEQ